MSALSLNQIALSVADVQHSQRWYRDVFGFQEAGGTHMFLDSLGFGDVVGIPGAAATCWWLMDSQDNFQLEFFQYRSPEPKPLPPDWRPCDIGYTTIGIHVDDFDAALDRLARRRVPLLSDPVGETGARRVCVRDPDGVLVEVMEDDPRAANWRPRPHNVPVATRFVTLSVPDLEQARRTWIEVLGLPEAPDVTLHGPEHERLWGLVGASRRSFVLAAGDLFIEVVQYTDPVGEPWPDGYVIADLGLLNIAFWLPSLEEHDRLLDRCVKADILPNTTRPTMLKKLWYATYVNDPMGFSIELLYHAMPGRKLPVNPFNALELGFVPRSAPVKRSEITGYAAAAPELVWELLVDHERMSDWSPFKTVEVTDRRADGRHVGTVRRLGGPARLDVTETIVAAEAPYRLEYRAKGLPGIWFHHGFVTLEPTPGGGTTITWEAQFRTVVPGSAAVTSATLRSLVAGLAATAEQAAIIS